MLIAAGEDVGLADPQAIVVVEACAAAFERVGLPEGLYPLAQAALYLAGTEKSNSVLGFSMPSKPSAESSKRARQLSRSYSKKWRNCAGLCKKRRRLSALPRLLWRPL